MLAFAPTPAGKLNNTLSLDKDYWFSCELRPGYLYVSVRSEMNDYHRARQYWNEIGVMLQRTHADRLLVDKDIAEQLSVTDAYRIASEVASELRHVKVAMCDRRAAHDNAEFGESVVRNRGLHAADLQRCRQCGGLAYPPILLLPLRGLVVFSLAPTNNAGHAESSQVAGVIANDLRSQITKDRSEEKRPRRSLSFCSAAILLHRTYRQDVLRAKDNRRQSPALS